MRLFRKSASADSEVGRPVFTSDDHHIGAVRQVEGNGIRIDSRMSKDYWLSRRDVQYSTEDRVVLKFGNEELDDYKRDDPPPDSVPEGITLEMEQEARRKLKEDERSQHGG